MLDKDRRKDRELDVYVKPSNKAKVLQKAYDEEVSRSRVVDEILTDYFKRNPIEPKPRLDY